MIWVEFSKGASITNAIKNNNIDLQKGVPILRKRSKMYFDLVEFAKGSSITNARRKNNIDLNIFSKEGSYLTYKK